MELSYIEDIKDDVYNMISNTMKCGSIYRACVGRVINENDYYMSSQRPMEQACHYIAIGACTVDTNNVNELIKSDKNDKDFIQKVVKDIQNSIEIIESGKYDNELTAEDRKYIQEDIAKIKNSQLIK